MSDHFLWNSEPFSKGQAWLDLLLHANFTDNEILIKGQVIKLKRGEQARSEVTLSKHWKWSRNKVRRFLELLKKEGMIDSKTTHLTSVISICNYNSFQAGDTANGTSVGTSVGTAGEQVTEHSKECKEGKEGNKFSFKNELIALGVEESIADDWLTVRKKKRASNTQTALNGLINQIEKTSLSTNEAIKLCVENSWSGFKADYIKDEASNIPYEKIMELFNKHCTSLNTCFDLTTGRKRGIAEIWNADARHQDSKFWVKYLSTINSSADISNQWENSADYAFNYKTFVKLMESSC